MSQFWLHTVLLSQGFPVLSFPVDTENLWDALGLLLKGMSGILLVMLLIFLVIVLLNKIFKKGKQEQEDKAE